MNAIPKELDEVVYMVVTQASPQIPAHTQRCVHKHRHTHTDTQAYGQGGYWHGYEKDSLEALSWAALWPDALGRWCDLGRGGSQAACVAVTQAACGVRRVGAKRQQQDCCTVLAARSVCQPACLHTPGCLSLTLPRSFSLKSSSFRFNPLSLFLNTFSPVPDLELSTSAEFYPPVSDLDLGAQTWFIKLVSEIVKVCLLMEEGR